MTKIVVIRRVNAQEQINYRLADSCGEQHSTPEHAAVGYRLKSLRGQYPIERIGQGWAEFGHQASTALVSEQDYEQVRRIMIGRHALTDQQLIKPKVAVAPAAQLAARPLVDALVAEAERRGRTVEAMLSKPALRERFARLERMLARKGETHRAPVQALDEIAGDVGIELTQLDGYSPEEVRHAREHAEERVEIGKVAHDLTVTRDRSNDVFRALATESMRLRSDELWMESVRDGVRLLEQWCSYGMAGHHGDGKSATRVQSSGWAATITWHRTTRSIDGQIGDPHLHAHVLIPHMIYCPDDTTWRTPAAGGYDLFRHCETIDHYIAALYRRRMVREFGVRYTYNPHNREWQIAGIPQPLIRHFSRRSAQIDAEIGKDASVIARQRAGRRTAGSKIASTPQEEQAFWRRHATGSGWVPEHVMRTVLGYEPPEEWRGAVGIRPPHRPDPDDVAAHVWDPEIGVTSSAKAVPLTKVMAAVAEACPDGLENQGELERLTGTVTSDTRAIALAKAEGGSHMSNNRRFTSDELVQTERRISAQARERLNEGAAAVPQALTQAAIDAFALEQGYPLSTEQARVVHRLTTAGHGIEALIGQAGSGKTTVMDAARRAWESAGLRVHGAATAAVAASRLRAGSRIPASTIASIQRRITSGQGLEGVDVLVLDEAAMMDDRALDQLMTEATRTGTKLVAIGDPQQLRAIGVGGAFKHIHQIVDGLSLTENYRQRDPVERAALQIWRTGQRATTVGMWSATGHIKATDDLHEAYAGMVAAWWQDWSGHDDVHEGIEHALMLAATNHDVAQLNARARVLARETGLLQGKDVSFALPGGERLEVGVGDLLRIRRNDYREDEEDVLNGYRGYAVQVDPRRGVLMEWREGEHAHRSWVDPEHIARGGLVHGYALTIAAAQGLTSSTCQVLGLGVDAHALYPAMSRVRERSTLWAPVAEIESEDIQEALGSARTDAERLDRVVVAISGKLTDDDDGMIIDEIDGSHHDEPAVVVPVVSLDQARAGQGPTMVEAAPRIAEWEEQAATAGRRAEELHRALIDLTTQLEGRSRWRTRPLARRMEQTHEKLDQARAEQRKAAEQAQRLRREATEADLLLARRFPASDPERFIQPGAGGSGATPPRSPAAPTPTAVPSTTPSSRNRPSL